MKRCMAEVEMEDTQPVECGFSVGDVVTYTNENGAIFPGMIIAGFRHEPFHGRFIYLDIDAAWFPVKPEELSSSHGGY